MFNDYKVIVTGVSSLLGCMLARAFLDDGAYVIGIDKDDSDLCEDRYCFIKYDFEVHDNAETIYKTIEERFDGHLDSLINVPPMQGDIDLWRVNGPEFERYFMASLFTAVDMNRKLYPMLRRSESGNPSVVNISSAISRSNDISLGLECLCSQALIKLTKMQAGCYDGVRCNSVSPLKTWDPENCRDIINAVLFLCSEDAGFITGSDFLMDYGESAKNAARLETQ